MQDKKFKDLLSISAFFLLCLYLYKDIIFAKGKIFSFLGSDIFYFNFPFDYLTFGSSTNHQISLWNPYIFLGEPLTLHPASPLFYPLNFIFFLLPLHSAINYSLLINTVLSGAALYFYLRYLERDRFSSFIGAAIFMFNAVVLLHAYAGHLPTLQTLPWLVLLFLFSEIFIRKNEAIWLIIAGLVLGIQILAGNAQYTFYTVIALAGYFVFLSPRGLIRSLSAYAVIILIGLGIAAIKLIPSLEFMRLSDRGFNNAGFVGSWSFPLRNLATYFAPELYGDIVRFQYQGEYAFWEMCGYVGILPLILSALALIYRRNKYTVFFAGLSAFAILGALGEHTPLFKLFYYFLPGFNKFRGHSKMIILFAFSASVLSAFGLSWFLERKEEAQKHSKRILLPIIILAVLTAALTWLMRITKSALPSALFSLSKLSLFLSANYLLLFFWFFKKIPSRVFKFLIFAIIISDLWIFGSSYIVANDAKNCYWDRKIVSFLKDQGEPYTYRVMSPNIYGPFPNKALLDGLHMVDGYDAIFLRRYLDLLNRFPVGFVDSKPSLRILSLVNLKFLVMPKNQKLSNPDLSITYQTNDVTVWQNSKYLPRVYIVHGARVIRSSNERISTIISDEHFEPLSTVILEQDPHLNTVKSLAQQPGERAEFLKYTNDEVIIRAVLNSNGYLVLSDYNYPGWQAQITNLDTGEHKCLEPLYADHIFRAIALEKSRYSVRFIFQPQSFYTGLKITLLTVIIVALGLVWLRIKNKLRC